jgi:SAM-dependent methyltransferase
MPGMTLHPTEQHSAAQQTLPYTTLARAYDHILRHVDYQSWYEYIQEVMHRYYGPPSLVIELGCGTGRFGLKFARDNYRIVGIDRSLDMLRVARSRAFKGFRLVCGDLKNFQLAAPADFIFAVHDTMNYLVNPSDLRRALVNLKGNMHERSVFLFDVTTDYNITTYFDGKTSRYSVAGMEVAWTNTFDRGREQVLSTLSFYRDAHLVHVEEHLQRIYSIDEISSLLDECGFDILGLFGDSTFHGPREDSVMINFVVRKKP